ncbi:MAG: sialate O-acetylesterase [Wujia sp.]
MLKTAAIFSDNMVLQRNKNIVIWGTTDSPLVEASINGVTVSATVRDGSFKIILPPMKAGGPYTLVISTDRDKLEYSNIMLGEVWLAGGQSNMEFELQGCKEGDKELANMCESVRFYYTPKNSWVGDELLEAEEKSCWELSDSPDRGKWSAVGYYFARELSKKLGVTVGVIGCNWGGTSASCWVSREYLEKRTELASYLQEYDEAVKDICLEDYAKAWDEYLVYQAEFDVKVGEYYKTCPNPTWDEAISLFGESKYPGPMGPRNFTRPCGLYETMLSRVCPYTIAGFIFYQGEEDDHKPYTYDILLETLIKQWRNDWDDDTLPFINVQLPIFTEMGEDDFKNWPLIREAQMRVYNTVKNTGIAVALEKGEIYNIHPIDKKPVGERLARQALYHVYKLVSAEEAFGPMYESHSYEADGILIVLKHVYGGLTYSQDVETIGAVGGFELAGEDKVYYKARASFADENTNNRLARGENKIVLKLTCDEVDAPVYARYCWTNYQEIGLFGGNGLPLAPFRTDTHDGAKATGSRKGFVIEVKR